MPITDYHAQYLAYELTKRTRSDNPDRLGATLLDARVDLNPHQVDAALFAFRSPLSKGAILADEVGLGKTIEAGLVISQKWAERKRRILVIAPANLRKQWNGELLDKFYLPSVILEKKTFEQQIRQGNLNPFQQPDLLICSYQFAQSKAAYLKATRWDLVVLDEAHRLRNVYRSDNRIGRALKEALDGTPKILLTATLLQNSLLELYGLVSLVDEYVFGDLRSFKSQFSRTDGNPDTATFQELRQRLKPICQRTLRRQVLEYIRFTDRIAIVEEFYPSDEEQRLYDLVTDYLRQDTLYALPNSQRALMTLVLRRLLASSTFAIAGTLGALVHRLDALAHDAAPAPVEENVAEAFETYEELADEWEEEEADAPRPLTDADRAALRREADRLREFRTLAETIRVNSKGQKLLTALERGFAELARLGAARKAIVFTESTRTQAYLYQLLQAQGFPGNLVLFNGSNTDEDSKQIYLNWLRENQHTGRITGSPTADKRAALVDYFRHEADVMIATEAAAEGINLQFCSLVINYDLPWNPQRIEQRIGRCHRYGQKHNVVVINFLNKANAADQRVYGLLSEKFKLFDGVFGASDEVLGAVENGVDFERRIARIYQNCRTAEQIDAAFAQLRAELDGQISKKYEDTRVQLLEHFDEEVTDKLRLRESQSQAALNRFEQNLWHLTRHVLADAATFSEHDFTLHRTPFADAPVELAPVDTGRYSLAKTPADALPYRPGHPLAQAVLARAKAAALPPREVVFDYAATPKKISLLEPHLGATGWLRVDLLTLTAAEAEDTLLVAALTDDGEALDGETACRLFSLDGREGALLPPPPAPVVAALEDLAEAAAGAFRQTVQRRNDGHFQAELDKLNGWANDQLTGLEKELKDIKLRIQELNRAAKTTHEPAAQLQIQKEIHALTTQQKRLRASIFDAEDAINDRRAAMIGTIEAQLTLRAVRQTLFTIRWHLV